MSHEIAKLLLEHADTLLERTKAVRTAISLGMPIYQIEAYLDWLDTVRPLKESPAGSQTPGNGTQPKPSEEQNTETEPSVRDSGVKPR